MVNYLKENLLRYLNKNIIMNIKIFNIYLFVIVYNDFILYHIINIMFNYKKLIGKY